MYAGVEGGATKTKCAILSKDGKVLGTSVGRPTNHWRCGINTAVERIGELIQEAKAAAGIQKDASLEGVGLALSGIDTPESKTSIEKQMKIYAPNLMREVHVWNDSVGAIATTSDSGGLAIISGTGSICVYMDEKGCTNRVGGVGHVLGDEGSAYWIALRAAKCLIDDHDGMKPAPFPVDVAKRVFFEYFEIDFIYGLLDHFYTKFDKARVAKVCIYLAKAAEEGDALCKQLFWDAGFALARMAVTIASRYQLKETIKILCVGSVWNSWNLLKDGFIEGTKPKYEKDIKISGFELMQLKVDATIGAAAFCAKTMGDRIPLTYADNFDVFYRHSCSE